MEDVLAGALGTTFAAFAIVIFVVSLVFLVCLALGRIWLFKKCGQSWWKAIIPIYSDYVMDCKVCGLHWAFFIAEALLSFEAYTRLVSLVIYAMRYYNLAKKFHKDPIPSTIFGAIFSSIVEMVYGFGSTYQYDENEPVGNCGFFNKVVK